jgi:ribose-phosphate pyrophosphokinase
MRGQSLLCGYIAENYSDHDMVVVSPDSGRVRVAEKWADALGGVPLAFIHKTRDPLVPNQVKSNRVVGDVKGKTCILNDDMIDPVAPSPARSSTDQDGAGDDRQTHVLSDRRRGLPSATPARGSSPTRFRSARTSSSPS